MDFESKIAEFREQDEEKSMWLEKMNAKQVELYRKYKEVCHDLKSEKDVRRSTQEREEVLQHKYNAVQASLETNSFVAVLIDGDTDGYIFNEKYILNGIKGGFEAAQDLKRELRVYLTYISLNLGSSSIVIRAYANLDNLLSVFRRAYIGKETVDSKIKGKCRHPKQGKFDQFLGAPQCKHIIFGACHDNGYVRKLEGFARDPDTCARLTLIGSFETGREFASLPFRSTKLGSIFRTTTVLDAVDRSCSSSRIPGERQVRDARGANGASVSWATIAKTNSNNMITTPQPSKPIITNSQPTILINTDRHRLDKPPPRPTEAAFRSLNLQILSCALVKPRTAGFERTIEEKVMQEWIILP
ncbi:MAG: hypothetical protein M1834_001772 [Cirrosporium novae-zelandiae]|nr:MAG: hypothetical protein M1834_001772 [Cirrosporium novae-zelandiae]